jgi:hypothetical protein
VKSSGGGGGSGGSLVEQLMVVMVETGQMVGEDVLVASC